MEELEKFSMTNNNETFVMPGADSNQQQQEEWDMSVAAQSSICESDLEYTQIGNIRASTYKRNTEN
jgi:hypothetical protein